MKFIVTKQKVFKSVKWAPISAAIDHTSDLFPVSAPIPVSDLVPVSDLLPVSAPIPVSDLVPVSAPIPVSDFVSTSDCVPVDAIGSSCDDIDFDFFGYNTDEEIGLDLDSEVDAIETNRINSSFQCLFCESSYTTPTNMFTMLDSPATSLLSPSLSPLRVDDMHSFVPIRLFTE
jgi:hypothetical protein